MAIGVRDITNLEELLEVQDNDKIIVIQNGEAKLISKANAKFGGGTVTLFYVDPNDASDQYKRLVDVNGNPISAQAAYDAVMSGPVYISTPETEMSPNKTVQGIDSATGFVVFRINGDVVSVGFDTSSKNYYAGENPNGGVS